MTRGLGALGTTLLVLVSSPAGARPASEIDSRLDELYERVSQKFGQNPEFRNSAHPELGQDPERNPLPPEYEMMRPELFKIAMKSYCALLESNESSKIVHPEHYAILDFALDSRYRRLYVYDVPHQEFAQNTWSTHGVNSNFSVLIKRGERVVLNYDTNTRASLFSNTLGTLQSSAGMSIVMNEPYLSENYVHPVRLIGVDGELNDQMEERAIVLHSESDMIPLNFGRFGSPNSEGCVMLIPGEFYESMRALMSGAPLLIYSERMETEMNETRYQEEVETLGRLESELKDHWHSLASSLGLSSVARQRELQVYWARLQELRAKVESTHRYFRTPSRFVGREPADPDRCLQVLGL